ncbi:MAG TPA: hypothetical protein DCZ75_15370 [Geobacter sp.]|nr:hypothetical protein [Geobacter sp.]
MKREKFLAAGLTVAIAMATVSGCATMAKKGEPALSAQPKAAAAKAAAPAPAEPTKYEPPILAGKVVESMQVGNYTYMLLEKDGRKAWAAVPSTEVKVGEEIILIPGIDMVDFRSSMLKRTFGNIHFSAGIQGQQAKPAEKPPVPAAPAAPAATTAGAESKLPPTHPALPKGALEAAQAKAAQAALSGKVVEAMDAGGYTYICLEREGGKTWAAIPSTDVKVGSEVTIQAGNVMPFFSSKSLKRNFENIIFSPGLAK